MGLVPLERVSRYFFTQKVTVTYYFALFAFVTGIRSHESSSLPCYNDPFNFRATDNDRPRADDCFSSSLSIVAFSMRRWQYVRPVSWAAILMIEHDLYQTLNA